MINQIRVRAQSSPWRGCVEILAMQGNQVGVIEWLDHPDGDMADPTIRLSMTDAQVLMDDLWHAGLRPTEGTGSAGALAATQGHLNDMRKLVFDHWMKGGKCE